MTQINVCKVNKQMRDKHKDSSLFPKQGDQNAKRTEKHIDKEQDKTEQEAPRSVKYRGTQNENNIGTIALERSYIYSFIKILRMKMLENAYNRIPLHNNDTLNETDIDDDMSFKLAAHLW